MKLPRWCATLWRAVRDWLGRSTTASTSTAVTSSPRYAGSQGRSFPQREVYGRIAPIFAYDRLGQDRRMQLCCCFVCGVIRQCTPDFDFYAVRDGAPLMCQNCFYQLVVDAQSGIKS